MENTEQSVLKLVTQDRIEIPLSSMYQKLKKAKKTTAKGLAATLEDTEGEYEGERVFAYTAKEDKERARGMKEAVAEFAQEFPKYGTILLGKIAEKRVKSEEHLYFGINTGCRLTGEDYMEVMTSLGLTEATSRSLYPDLMDVSRKLAKARQEERSIIVGRYANDAEDNGKD